MASTPKMEYQVFLCIFQKNSAKATLGSKEMGKLLWEGREKSFMKSGLDAMPLFLLDDLLINHLLCPQVVHQQMFPQGPPDHTTSKRKEDPGGNL